MPSLGFVIMLLHAVHFFYYLDKPVNVFPSSYVPYCNCFYIILLSILLLSSQSCKRIAEISYCVRLGGDPKKINYWFHLVHCRIMLCSYICLFLWLSLGRLALRNCSLCTLQRTYEEHTLGQWFSTVGPWTTGGPWWLSGWSTGRPLYLVSNWKWLYIIENSMKNSMRKI